MSKLRTGVIAAGLVALLLIIPARTSAQATPDVRLSGIEWQPISGYISGARFNADKSGRLEDDYFGYPGSLPLPPEENRYAPYLQSQGYNLSAKVTNYETKAIRSVVWDITYFEGASKTQKLGCRRGILLGKISPGKTRTLRQNVSAVKFQTSSYSTINLLRVVYTDNTAWLSAGQMGPNRGDSLPCGL